MIGDASFRPEYILPGTRIGSYVVQTQIGQGTGAVVYEAVGPDGGHHALKVSRYQATSQLDLGLGDTAPTLRRILSAFRDLAIACAEMARAGIVHRNLTPANVLMTPDGVPKIIGFHSATHRQAELLTFPEACGQPGSALSLSPELCKAIILQRTTGKDVPFSPAPPGDLHALGCILYEVLIGAHPFDTREDGLEQLRIIAHRRPQRPSVLNPSIPRGLTEVVMGLGLIRFGGRLSKQVEGVHGIGAEEAEAGKAELHR